ncbi:MAG TPA: C39 family peptidase [Jatrophihabitans sp.]|nr:C39 family peptidase [Jatrophihabitans sp.]
MRIPRPRRVTSVIVPLTLALPAAGLLFAGPAAASPAGTPQVGQYDHVAAPAVTGAEKSRDDAKQAQALKHTQARQAAALSPNAVTPNTTAKTLGVSYQQQVDSTWCGPATLAIILGYKGWGWSGTASQQQTSAANLLGVPHNGDGTPWQGSDNVPLGGPWVSSYPMQDALNYRDYVKTGNTYWAVHALPGSPSSGDVTEYKNDLTTDIDLNYPFANNEYAAPGYEIGKQPGGMWIYHWFAANGYSNSGSTTIFSDPGWGGGSKSSDTTHNVVVALGGRGYIW